MKRSITLCAILCLAAAAFADTTEVVIGSQVTGNTIPFWGSGYAGHRFQTIFLQSEINLAGEVISIAVMPEDIANPTYNNLRMYFCHTTRSNDLSTVFNDNYNGGTPELVFDSASCTFTVGVGQWLEFPVSFEYDNINNLLWEIRWRGSSGQNTYIWRWGSSGSGTFRVFFLGSDSSATGSADFVRYYVKFTIVTQTGVQEVVVGERDAAAGLTVRPNPVQRGREVRIDLTSTRGDDVKGAQVYDLNGRFVRYLCAGRDRAAVWDLKDETGVAVPSGVYFLRAGTRTGMVTVID